MKIHPTLDHLQFIEFEAMLRFDCLWKETKSQILLLVLMKKKFIVNLKKNTLDEAKQIDGYEQIWEVKSWERDCVFAETRVRCLRRTMMPNLRISVQFKKKIWASTVHKNEKPTICHINETRSFKREDRCRALVKLFSDVATPKKRVALLYSIRCLSTLSLKI